MKHIISSLLIVTGLSACTIIPPEAYYNRGAPESLLDVSSEVVNLPVGSDHALDEMTNWIHQDQPTRAELYCTDASPQCAAAMEVLALYGVPTVQMASPDNAVSLVYERVLARDCENRFIDNSINPYNFNHPTLGCSTAVNMVQMVTDKHQFVRPNLMDMPRATKAVQAYQTYLQPREVKQSKGLKDSVLDEATVD